MTNNIITPYKMKSKKQVVIQFLLGLLTLFMIGCGNKQQQVNSLLTVKVSPAIKKTITEWDEFTGRFEATNRVEVRARVSGYINKVNFRDGQMVKKGDVLFIIDQRPYRIALQEARASYARAQANYKQATDNFNRVKSLRESGAVSLEEYDSREQAVAGNLAQLQVAQAAIDNAKLNLEFSRVTAPISGRIGRDLINEGNLINGGTTSSTLLTTIVATDPIHFYFTGSESDFLKYSRLARTGKRGSSRDNANPVEVRLADETEFDHKGVMDFVNNEISRSTGAIEARAIFENKDHLLEPGMFGRARLQGRSEYEVLMVPDALIGTNQTVKFLYTVGTDSIVKTTPIELGNLYQSNYRIIKDGLSPEDKIVVSDIQKLFPGMKVAFSESEPLINQETNVTKN